MSFDPLSQSQFDSALDDVGHTSRDPAPAANSTQSLPRKWRWLRWLGRFSMLVVGLILAGVVYEALAEDADRRAFPAPGQMVDIGGYRLHINCIGTGSPTVILESGWGNWSLLWAQVQEDVAKTTRVCAYDRAGMGYSEAGPLPRDAQHMAVELHTLLEQAGIAGPYVMVGHSLGGIPVRIFAHDYPNEVSGVVLIDSMSPRQRTEHAAVAAEDASEANGGLLPTVLARIGLVRMLAEPLGVIEDLPAEIKAPYKAFTVIPRGVQAWADEGASMSVSLAQADAIKTLGDLPLIVLTAGLNDHTDWQAMQAEMLLLSSNSRQIVVENSGHGIQIDQPQAAVAAIVDMVLQVR